MADTTECPSCGDNLKKVDDLETTDVSTIDTNEDDTFTLFGNDDLFP